MKRTNLLKSMLLLCALVVGSGSVWAGDVKTTFTFNDATERAKIIAIKTGTQTDGGDTELQLENITLSSAKGYYDGSKSSTFNVYGGGTMTVSLKSGVSGYIKSIKITYPKCYPFKTPTGWSATSDQASWSTTEKMTSGKYIEYSTTAENISSVNLVNEAGGKTNPQIIEVTYVVNSLTASFGAGKTMISFSNSVCALDLATGDGHRPAGLNAYKVSAADDTSVTLTEVTSTVAKNTGLILVGSASSSYIIPVVASGSDISSTNKLVATDGVSTVSSAAVLSNGEFHPLTSGVIAAGKAYLPYANIEGGDPFTGGAHALDIVFDNGDVTGIEQVANSQDSWLNGQFYDLQGRKIAQPTKGLYIVNGKKVIIK